MKSIVLWLAAALCCGSVHAAVPHQINYQGYLTGPSGTPVNTSVQMGLRLYDVPAGGVALHDETQTVAVANGVFNVLIGAQPGNALALPFDKPYFSLSGAYNTGSGVNVLVGNAAGEGNTASGFQALALNSKRRRPSRRHRQRRTARHQSNLSRRIPGDALHL